MSKLWKNLRTNMMYWRFRYITRNRLRLRSWLALRKGPRMTIVPPRPRERAVASYSYQHSARGTWLALLAMVLLLTGLKVLANYYYIIPSIVYAIGMLIVVGAIYLSLRRA
jgi:hypothetical protein